jgi:hypothetical protein
MIKYILILGANIFILYCFIMFMVDHTLIPKELFPLIRNIVLFVLALWICYDVVRIYVLQKQTQESGMVYKVAAKSKTCGLAFYYHIKPFQKEFVTWTLIAAGVAFLGMLLMGIPGYLLLAIPAKLGIVQELQGDDAWPAAILTSMLWPLFFPIGILVKQHLIKIGYLSYAFPGFLGTVLIGIIGVVTLIYVGYRKSSV